MTSTSRTARCGPACRVVWQGCSLRATPYADVRPCPDNPRAVVAQPDRYEARVNDSVLDFARHYDCSVLPARVRKPQDKAVVESAVQVVERWIMARLRHVRLPDLIEDASNELPGMFRRLIDQLLTHLRWLDEQIETIKKEIYVWHRNNADSTDETEHLSQH